MTARQAPVFGTNGMNSQANMTSTSEVKKCTTDTAATQTTALARNMNAQRPTFGTAAR